tara:strand:+ start:201 stop:572 length:372 start_codon:yes stop_codon:yes gene_type:complete
MFCRRAACWRAKRSFENVATTLYRAWVDDVWVNGFKTSIRGFCQIAGGNQRAAAADRPLESHGAPEDHTLSSTYVNDVNVTSVDRPSMAKLRFVQHPCCKLLIINSVSGVITGNWSMLVDWCL